MIFLPQRHNVLVTEPQFFDPAILSNPRTPPPEPTTLEIRAPILPQVAAKPPAAENITFCAWRACLKVFLEIVAVVGNFLF